MGSVSEREGDLEQVGLKEVPGLGVVVRGLGTSRAELLFLDPCPGQAGVALWFLKSVSPSLPSSGSPGLARIWKRFMEWGISARVHSQVDVPGPGRAAGTSSGDPAFYIGYPAMASSRSSYLALYNILNFPAGVVPVTTVMLQDEEELAFYRGYYRDRSEKDFQEVVRGSVGLSAAVQGTALP
ncbi:fatty-acid amide hydrolase 1-like isoform X3 [Orcinus orca]|uniref:fatty-acid amide hydrolase 1-like isoform X3 n=1 Tax=Orcinus orca TaxID=9733 RepID=UPI00062B7A4F|nr:fatty-acid amide hydrolase 1-like isoform X3 [Orcinus orca]